MTHIACQDAGGEPRLHTALDGERVLGYVAVDSRVGGRSCGGLRLQPRIDPAHLQALARAMTLKYGLLGLPQGGAKAGVCGDPEAPAPQRRGALARFARAIRPLLLRETFVPSPDVGTDAADIRHMLRSAGVSLGRRQLRGDSSGYYTAMSVLAAADSAMRSLGLDLRGCTAAVEGFGKVGAPLAGLLAGRGAKVVAVSTSRGAIHDPAGLDVRRLAEEAERSGSRFVEVFPAASRLEAPALLELPVDLLCPCAVAHTVREDSAPRLRARVVCPGANLPLTEGAERMLQARGVLCVPDFLANCGGVLGGTMEFACVGTSRIAEILERHLGAVVAWLLEEARRRGSALRPLAEEIALRRLAAVRQRAARPTPAGRLLKAGLAIHRRGLLPRGWVGPLAERYFERSLAALRKECAA